MMPNAYNLALLKAKQRGVEALHPSQKIEDITVILTDEIHVISITPSHKYFIFLSVENQNSNLALVKILLKAVRSLSR